MIDESQLVDQILEAGLIDSDTLDRVAVRSRQDETSLYEALIFGGHVDEGPLVALVADFVNVPAVTLSRIDLTEDVIELVPGSMAVRNRVVPVRHRNDELVLAMVDPLDVLAMDEVATHTGIDIRPVIVGPRDMSTALEKYYGTHTGETPDADDVFASLDSFDVDGVVDDMIGDDSWAEFFDSAQEVEVTEDSAVISQDMRDRPSTDVLSVDELEDEDDELEEIEIIEELDQPVDPARRTGEYASLDQWEVDEAITSSRTGKFEREESAEIISSKNAGDLFAAEESGEVRLDQTAIESDDDTTTQRPATDDDSPLDDTKSTRTSVGVGVEALAGEPAGAALRATDDEVDESGVLVDTNRTRLGVGTRGEDSQAEDDASEGDDAKKPTAKKTGAKRAKKRPETEGGESTDYGALGRAILKGEAGEDVSSDAEQASSPDSEEVTGGPAADSSDGVDPQTREVDVDEHAAALGGKSASADKARVPVRTPEARPQTEPKTREMDADHLLDLTDSAGHSSLDEATKAADARQREAMGEMMEAPESTAGPHARETAENASVTQVKARQARRTAPVDAILRIPDDISDRALLLAALHLLSANDVLDLEELVGLASHLSSNAGDGDDEEDGH